MILSHYIWTSFDDHFDPEDSDCLVMSASVACQHVLSWTTSWRGLSYSVSFFLLGKLNALEASAVSEVREGLVEADDGFDLVLVDQKEKVRVN